MMNNVREMNKLLEDKPEVVLGLTDLIVGTHIGSGCFRDVYEHVTNKNWVVKIQRDNSFSNILEFELWCSIKDTKYAKWFAQCHWMSNNGKVLIQEKIKPITKKNSKNIPKTIPYFFTDVKKSNFGFRGTQLVCHDYDYSIDMFISNGLNKKTRSSKELKTR